MRFVSYDCTTEACRSWLTYTSESSPEIISTRAVMASTSLVFNRMERMIFRQPPVRFSRVCAANVPAAHTDAGPSGKRSSASGKHCPDREKQQTNREKRIPQRLWPRLNFVHEGKRGSFGGLPCRGRNRGG